MYKALINFGCNGLYKKVGDKISKEEAAKMGNLLEAKLVDGWLILDPEYKEDKKEEPLSSDSSKGKKSVKGDSEVKK